MDTLIVVAVLFFSIGYAALMVMFTIKTRQFRSAIKEMAEKLNEEQQHSSKLWHQLDDAYAAKEELRNELDDAQHAAEVAEQAWQYWNLNYHKLLSKYNAALQRGDEFKSSATARIRDLEDQLHNTESLVGEYYDELQQAKELLKVVEWAAKTEVIAAKPRVIKAVPPTVQPQLATLLAAASISPQLKRMLGL